MRKKRKNKKIIVAVSGGFDPVHVGHVRLFQEAKKLGDELVVILNNDHWLRSKKGFVFMPERERKELLEGIGCVNKVMLTKHKAGTKDLSVCRTLRELKPRVFANGGDRTRRNIPEIALCKKIGTKMIFGVGRGGKVQSSSRLLKKFHENSGSNPKS